MGEILNALRVLNPDGHTMELRVPKSNFKSVITSDMELIEKTALSVDGMYQAVYVTLNPVDPAFSGTYVADKDILSRMWILIDCDPERPSNTSSTDVEKAAAYAKMEEVKLFLSGKGFPEPVVADSGNGYHLLYKTNLPKDAPVAEFLNVIHELYSNDAVKIDKVVFNPSRITKLYGTKACKGENTTLRPHRRSQILSVPAECKAVTQEMLEGIIHLLAEPPKKNATMRQVIAYFKQTPLDDWFKENGIAVSKVKVFSDRTLYELKECPFNADHVQESHVTAFINGCYDFSCFHNSCSGHDIVEFIEQYDPEWLDSLPDDGSDRKSLPVTLFELLQTQVKMFKDQNETAYINVNGATYPVESSYFRDWLTKISYTTYKKVPSTDAIRQVASLVTAFASETKYLSIRVAWHDKDHKDTLYYDLGSENWDGIKIDDKGWEYVDKLPTLFTRFKSNYDPQVMPQKCAVSNIERLWKHVNIKDPDRAKLLAVCLVSFLMPEIPHPIPVFYGTKGAAKSTTMRMIKSLVDPSPKDLLGLSDVELDNVLNLAHSYFTNFDNISYISAEQSDLFSKACTGNVISKRALYTNQEEILFKFKHCLALNGLGHSITKSDLMDRTLLFELERISKEERKAEEDIWKAFNTDKPFILGAMFEAAAQAIGRHEKYEYPHLERLADFDKWGCDIAEALGYGAQWFADTHAKIAMEGCMEIAETNPVLTHLVDYFDSVGGPGVYFEGSLTDLIDKMKQTCPDIEQLQRAKKFPVDSTRMSRVLAENKVELEAMGFTVATKRTTSKRVYVIKRTVLD